MYRYELIVCWSDKSWTDCEYIYSEKDNLTREEAENQFVSTYMAETFAKEKGKRDGLVIERDIAYVGIYCGPEEVEEGEE
jgi:hypothetical protein